MLDHFSTVVYKPVPVHVSAPKCSSSMIKVIGSLWSYWRGLLRPYHSSKRKRRYVENFIFGSTKYGPTPKPKKKDETSVHQEVESEISMSRSFSNWYYLANLFNSSPNLKYCYLGWLPSYTIAITSVTSPSLCRSTCRSKSDAQLRWDKSPRCSCGTEWLKWIEIGGSLGSFKVWKWVIPCDTQSLYHFMPFVWLKHVETDDKESNIIKFGAFLGKPMPVVEA